MPVTIRTCDHVPYSADWRWRPRGLTAERGGNAPDRSPRPDARNPRNAANEGAC